jgi:hypothetical protein
MIVVTDGHGGYLVDCSGGRCDVHDRGTGTVLETLDVVDIYVFEGHYWVTLNSDIYAR